MKRNGCSVCPYTALAVSISALALVLLFWAIILVVILIGSGPTLAVKGNNAGSLLSGVKITDLTGGFTALCALAVAVGSLIISFRHHRLSVRPRLSIIRVVKNNDGKKKGLYVRNHGLGPALIKSIRFESKSQNLVMESREELGKITLHYALASGDLGNYWLDMLPKDSCERLLWLEVDSFATKDEFDELISDIRLTITYESFYGEKEVEVYE